MDIQERVKGKLAEIKKLLFNDEQAQKFVEATLVDGTVVSVEPAVEVGAVVSVIGDGGEMLPAPDASHELQDGTLVVTEGGIIVEIVAVAEAPAEPAEAAAEPNKPAALSVDDIQAAVMQKVSQSIAERINSMKFAAAKDVAALKKENGELKKALGELADVFEAFATAPVAEPKKKVSNPFKADAPNGNIDRWLAMRKQK
jgi:preprotein translocase subunit YajC